MALGLIEVFGFTTAILVADAAAKAANVEIVALDKNKPAAGDDAEVPLIMQVKLQGNVADVKESVEAGVAMAKRCNMYVIHHVISRETEDTKKMAAICDVGKDKFQNVIKIK